MRSDHPAGREARGLPTRGIRAPRRRRDLAPRPGGRRHHGQLLVRPRDLLDAEAGVGVVQQRSTARVDQSFGVGRAALSYKHSFTETALLQELLELLSNLKDSKDQLLNSETSLTAPLSKRIALKAAYLIRYDNLPEPGFKKSDRVFTTGIQILF